MSKLYKKSGVDVIKTDKLISQALKFIKSSHNNRVLGNKLGFSAEYKVNKDVTLCAASDGVGTKAILAAEQTNIKELDKIWLQCVQMICYVTRQNHYFF